MMGIELVLNSANINFIAFVAGAYQSKGQFNVQLAVIIAFSQ